MAEEKFEPAGFKMSLGLKDTNLALAAAEQVSAKLPLAELAKSHFESGVAQGFGDLDWAALIKCINNKTPLHYQERCVFTGAAASFLSQTSGHQCF